MIKFVDTGKRTYNPTVESIKLIKVVLDREYTVREFCSAILSERSPNEWGEFIVDYQSHRPYKREYDHGEVLESIRQYFPRKVLDKVIDYVTAYHNEKFNRIDYHIEVKEEI